jgi:hypothetical protein
MERTHPAVDASSLDHDIAQERAARVAINGYIGERDRMRNLIHNPPYPQDAAGVKRVLAAQPFISDQKLADHQHQNVTDDVENRILAHSEDANELEGWSPDTKFEGGMGTTYLWLRRDENNRMIDVSRTYAPSTGHN